MTGKNAYFLLSVGRSGGISFDSSLPVLPLAGSAVAAFAADTFAVAGSAAVAAVFDSSAIAAVRDFHFLFSRSPKQYQRSAESHLTQTA